MIFLYTVLRVLLGTVAFLFGRRAARLEKRYIRSAQAADRILRAGVYKPGNGGRPDLCLAAKQQYQLGQLVHQRDQLEQRYAAWRDRAERLRRWSAGLRDWQGRKLPYTLGAVDVACVLGVIDYLGMGEYVSARRLLGLVLSLYQGQG
jgi:hypothetical protein